MKKGWIVFLIIILLGIILFLISRSNLFEPEEMYLPSRYEENLIDYFKDIALNTEYYDNPEKVIKWRETMYMYIYKEKDAKEQMTKIRNTIKNINDITSDGFKIEIVNDYKKANAFLYLCKKSSVKELAPKFYDLLSRDEVDYKYSGLTYVEFKWTTFVITRALIFIDIESSLEDQNSAIIEEITQSIGLLNDSNKYPNSVFYENESIPNSQNLEYSKMDIALINFLYNPKMKPGYNSKTSELVIKKILRDENKVLNK